MARNKRIELKLFKNRRKYTGLRIRNLRKENKMSVDEVASHLGLQKNQLYRIERGEQFVDNDLLMTCAKLFQIENTEFASNFETHL